MSIYVTETIAARQSIPAMHFRKLILLFIILITGAPVIGAQKMEEVIARMQPYSGPQVPGVDPSTLTGKVMCGYQGWFAAKGDGSERGWFHYGGGKNGPKPGNCTFDLWPDMSELDADEKFPTSFKYKDGSTAHLFSSYHKKTVTRHFQWMKEYGIDGVFLQRFASSLRAPRSYHHRNVVTANVQAGANQYGRTWAMMYDLSGLRAGEIESVLIPDWKRLVEKMKITEDKSYLHHKGKPVVAVWGIGFNDGRDYSIEECEMLVRFLKDSGTTVMLGVPTAWRTLKRDAIPDQKLHEVIALADIVSPWTVGRYHSPESAQRHAETIVKPDIAWAKEKDLDYLPVAYPGFSWRNLQQTHGKDTKLDQIPRLNGEFLWSQGTAFKNAGAQMLYVAMFDEIDEGTAIFKCTNNPPVGETQFLTYGDVPSDHYLWLTGKLGALLRGEIVDTELPGR